MENTFFFFFSVYSLWFVWHAVLLCSQNLMSGKQKQLSFKKLSTILYIRHKNVTSIWKLQSAHYQNLKAGTNFTSMFLHSSSLPVCGHFGTDQLCFMQQIKEPNGRKYNHCGFTLHNHLFIRAWNKGLKALQHWWIICTSVRGGGGVLVLNKRKVIVCNKSSRWNFHIKLG